jgi:uncharacterized protein
MRTRVAQDSASPHDADHTSTTPSKRSNLQTGPARQATLYVGLVYALTVAVALALPHAGITPLVTLVLPLITVLLITAFATRRGERKALWGSFGLRHAGLRSWPAAFALPVIFLAAGYAVAAMLGIARFPITMSASVWGHWAIGLGEGLAFMTVLVLGEEIGWRGYLLPRVQALVSQRRAALITGFIHGLFHLPLILLTTTYDHIGNRYIVAVTVVATITAAGVFYAWLKDRSRSVWPVAVAHGTVDLVFSIGAAAVITKSPLALSYTAGESGIVTLVAVVLCAIVLLRYATVWQRPRVADSQPDTAAQATAA